MPKAEEDVHRKKKAKSLGNLSKGNAKL